MTRSRCAALAVLLLVVPARAQELLHPLTGGDAVEGVRDLDGDGYGDLIVGTYTADRVYLYSGATGALLRTLSSPNPEPDDYFGGSVAALADVDGDGVDDVLVGAYREDPGTAPTDAGRAYVFSGATGALLFTLASPNEEEGGKFGSDVAGIPDADGDGVDDFVVGAYEEEEGAGRAYVFSGVTGGLLQTTTSPNAGPSDAFGYAVAGTADADGDGRGDLLVGAPGEDTGAGSRAGRAYLFSGATGALLETFAAPNGDWGDEFGYEVEGVSDVDGDGVADFAVGAPREIYGGGAHLFSGADGALLLSIPSPIPNGAFDFGSAIAGVEDVDGDGTGDLFVGAPGARVVGGYERAGLAFVLSGADGAVLAELRSPNPMHHGGFGTGVAGVPDTDGDGMGDLLVGTRSDESRSYLFSGAFIPFTVAPESYDFGTTLVGQQSEPLAVRVENIGSSPVTFTEVALEGGDPGQFALTPPPPLPFVLQPGETATVQARFVPTREGPATARLVVEGGGRRRAIPLRGVGEDLVPGAAFTVTKSSDSNDGACDADCSLREAVVAANNAPGDNAVVFASTLAGQEVQLTTNQLVVRGGLRVDAEGQGVTIRQTGAFRVLSVDEGATVELVGLTITGGRALDGGGIDNRGTLVLRSCAVVGNRATRGTGGGIQNARAGTLTLEDSAVLDNVSTTTQPFSAASGGGIGNLGTLRVVRSTIRGNLTSPGMGGGIYNGNRALYVEESTISGNRAGVYGGGGIFNSGGSISITRSTLSGNEADGGGGGVRFDGSVHIANSTITGNEGGLYATSNLELTLSNAVVAGNLGSDCSFTFGVSTSRGHNVVSAGTGCPSDGPGDATVAVEDVFALVLDEDLEDNGGPTPTHALLYRADNPALDLGGTCGPVDQRGFPAPLDGSGPDATATCDAGAVEADAPALAVALVPQDTPVVIPPTGGAFTFTAAITNEGAEPQTFQAWARAALPDGTTTGVLVGPVAVTLQPGQSLTRALTQQVPAGAPAGAYRYVAYVGTYPGGAVDGASFGVVKEGAAGRMASTVEWLPAGGWAADGLGQATGAGLPRDFALRAAHPNPFTGRTTLGYALPVASHVRLAVYDALGREVVVLADREAAAGHHEATLDGSRLPAGTYLVRLEAGGQALTRRVTVIR